MIFFFNKGENLLAQEGSESIDTIYSGLTPERIGVSLDKETRSGLVINAYFVTSFSLL